MFVDRIEIRQVPKEVTQVLAALGTVAVAAVAIAAASESIKIREGVSLPALELFTGWGEVEVNEFGIYETYLEPCPPKSLRGARAYVRELIMPFPALMRWSLPSGHMRSPQRLVDYRSCLNPSLVVSAKPI